MASFNLKDGLGVEAWLKRWEGGFTHSHSHVHDGDAGHDGGTGHHHHHSHGHHHSSESEVDSKGNPLKVDIHLKRNLEQLTDGKTDKTVLVSLCGCSPDMEWLASKGYSVVGVELSEIAVKQAFEKKDFKNAKPIPYEVSTDGNLKIYSATDGKNMKVYVSDFFNDSLTPEKLGTFDCIWDSHGIISLPPSQQEPCAKKLLSFLKPGGKMLYSTVEFDITKLKSGPVPGVVSLSVLQGFYPKHEVKLLETSPLPPGILEGVDELNNLVMLVTSK